MQGTIAIRNANLGFNISFEGFQTVSVYVVKLVEVLHNLEIDKLNTYLV